MHYRADAGTCIARRATWREVTEPARGLTAVTWRSITLARDPPEGVGFRLEEDRAYPI
jgi:hypothetical protein